MDTNQASLSEEEKTAIAYDQSIPYACEIAVLYTYASIEQQQVVEKMMVQLNKRALRSGMIVLNTQMWATIIPASAPEERPFLHLLLNAQWIKRDDLEKMQRQQALLPGGKPPMRAM